MKWISEEAELPPIGQPVLFMDPRQGGDVWDTNVACILARYEGVCARPVKRGSKWPTDYYWGRTYGGDSISLITGNGYWAWLDDIPLPPGAEHRKERGQHWIAQPTPVFTGQKR